MSIGSLKLKRGAVGGGEGIKRVVSYYTDVLSLFLLYILVNICPRLFVYSYITGMLSQRDYANITDRLGLCSLFFFCGTLMYFGVCDGPRNPSVL